MSIQTDTRINDLQPGDIFALSRGEVFRLVISVIESQVFYMCHIDDNELIIGRFAREDMYENSQPVDIFSRDNI